MKKSIFYILIISLVAIGVYFLAHLYFKIGNEVGDELNIYTDSLLGFEFEYPLNWTLFLDNDPIVLAGKERQEQVILQKNNAIILIDPLGRRGADSFPDPIEEEEVVINNIRWHRVYWLEGDYYRFVDVDGFFALKEDSTTDITSSLGVNVPRRSFSIHIYLENVYGDQNRQEILNTANKLLESLNLLQS